ncbi:hypothetical protein DBL07_23390 [Achromobacter mucicolens]|uniref:hypothetical protein n=1 Tax=Achromobacter mucicolens TaxID=1389922 RepID=UPI000D46C473|nr:hypothetical protein [Achromobacter mucicolens]PTW87139.1 hypothetical protein DBL07_23390 [Achromobacter mucicolens]
MNDILDAISARVKAPYFGYVLLAFVGLNWRGIFLLAMTEGTPQDRLESFDAQTSLWSLLLFPLITGALVTILSPWIKLIFNFMSKRPVEYMDNLYLDSEHRKTIRKTQLEQSRADLFASKESELIERAKRDKEVLEIEDDQLKKKLTLEIEELRRERDRMSSDHDSVDGMRLSFTEKEMIKAAAQEKTGTITRNQYIGGRTIQIGSRSFGEQGSRDFSKYDSALNSLVAKGLVANVGSQGGIFELTHAGWQIADAL